MKREVTATFPSIEEVLENFRFLDDWNERYRYLIELGAELAGLSPEERSAENRVQGCVSRAWLVVEPEGSGHDPMLSIRGDSEAHIVKGIMAILLTTFRGKRASEVVRTDPEALFAKLDLRSHLTPNRSNGVNAMIAEIKAKAHELLSGDANQSASSPY